MAGHCARACAKQGRTSELRPEESSTLSVMQASSAPSASGSCSRFPRAVTSSRSVNSASPDQAA